MCAEFNVRTDARQIEVRLSQPIKNVSKNDSWNMRVKLTKATPVIARKDGELRLNELIFPIMPPQNARLSNISSNRTAKKVAPLDEQVVRIYDVPM